ncbi:hypothetical protein JCM31598_00830 [Desulfonatronum parangueonense]
MSKEKSAEMVSLIPHEAMQILKEEAYAARLVDTIFGLCNGPGFVYAILLP